MLPSISLYAGLALIGGGALSSLFRRGRRRGLVTIASGATLAAIALAWPARESHVSTRRSHLDDIVPVWHFDEVHSIEVAAPPERVYAAMRAVTPAEIFLFGTLTAVRRLACDSDEGILNAPPDRPILDSALRGGFELLVDDAPRELVVGVRVARDTVAVMNFRVEPGRLTTETRVFARTSAARRKFAVYWRLILPGSDIIRRNWLAAIARRASTMH